jgi:MFS family permease
VNPGYARYALAIIFSANFFSYLDRQLVSALEEPITSPVTGLGLSSAEFGFLWTLFTLGYMICAPFIGYFSDRYRRTRIFAFCVFIWSLATIASGLATVKWLLYTSRVFIGLGEAGCLVIGSALISDFFGKENRGRALSIFYLGLPIGGTAAFIMAGLLLDLGWRWLFVIAGAPGFIITVLIWMMIDPPRGSSDQPGGHDAHGPAPKGAGVGQYLQLLKTPTLMFVILAQAFAVIILVPLVHFGVQFFIKERGMGLQAARLSLGVIALVAGAAGNSLSGWLGDRLRKKYKGGYAAMAGVSFLLGLPCLLVGFSSQNRFVFLPALTLGAFCIFLCMPAVNTQIANSARPTQRAMAWALAVFILHLLGDTLSPPVFGKVDELIGRYKAFMLFSFALIPASLCCFIAARTAARDEARIAEDAKQP